MGKASITIAVSSVFNGSGINAASKSIDTLGSKLSRMERLAAMSVNSVSSDLARYGQAWIDAGKRTEEAGKKISTIGDTLTKYVTVPMLAVGSYAGKMAVEFDTALANVRKVTDMTGAELEELAQSALELSTTQPVDASTILNVQALGAQLGIARENLETFAVVATGLDIATNMDAETAATEMARFANIVGMAEGDMERYGSTIVEIGNNMATTESEVSQMAMRFASAGAQAGLSEAEILGMAGAMSSLGIKAEMGGSALSQIFVGIGNAVSSGGDALELFASRAGMSADQFARAWRNDAAGAFNALIEGIGKATSEGEDMNSIMAELGYTQIRQSDVMRRLAGSTEAVTDKTSVLSDALDISTKAWEQNTALQSEVDQRNESMAARLQVLKNRIDEIAITVGRPLVDAVIGALNALDPLIQSVADAARAFADMDEEGQRNILMWAGIAAAAGPALSMLGRVTQIVGKGMQAWGAYSQKVAVVSDAMYGLDGANLRTYGSSKSLASQIGLSGNAAVKAAGGVDNYVKAWDAMHVAAGRAKKSELAMNDAMEAAMSASGDARVALLNKVAAHNADNIAAVEDYKANARLVSAFGKSTTEAEKAAEGIKSLAPSLNAVKNGMSSSDKVIARHNASLKAAGTAAKTAGVSMGTNLVNGARLAAGGMMGFIKACAPMIAVTTAVSAVGYAYSVLAEKERLAKEHQDLLVAASTTFADISSAAAMGAQSQAAGIGSVAERAREAAEGVKSMNEQSVQTMTEYENTSATLDNYVGTIAELGKKGKLSAVEQEKLKVAVAGYNEITGESVSITDESTGELSVNSDELRDNAAAWKENAEAQALKKIAQGYTEELTKASLALAQAQDAYAQKSAEVESMEAKLLARTDQGSAAYNQYASKVGTAYEELAALKGNLDEATVAYNSADASLQQVTGQMALSTEEGQKFRDKLASMPEVATVFDSMGLSIDSLAGALLGAGVSTEQLNLVGSANIAMLATAFNGNIANMVWAIQNYNEKPMFDKNGNVTVDQAELIDAQGNVYTYNETDLFDKNGIADVDYIELRNAQGDLVTWNKSKLSLQSTKASANTKEVEQGTKNKEQYNKTKPENQKATAKVGYGSVTSAYKANAKYNDSPPQNFSATSTIDNYINTHRTEYVKTVYQNAAGGMSRGVTAFHARGGIATRATDVTHIMGEAGAEALIPLSNRTYVRPFARAVADEFHKVSGSGGNTYVLNINGAQLQSASPRAMEAIRAIFDEFNLTNQMGVM